MEQLSEWELINETRHRLLGWEEAEIRLELIQKVDRTVIIIGCWDQDDIVARAPAF